MFKKAYKSTESSSQLSPSCFSPVKAHLRALGATRGDTLARLGLGTASDAVVGPGPVLAVGAKDVDVGAARLDGADNLVDGEVGDGDASGGSASGAAILVVLLNDDSVLGNVGQRDVVVLDVGDGASSARNGLDAHAVVRVGDLGVEDANRLDDVVGAAADGANRDAVAAAAVTASKGDVGSRVDGEAVVLVLDDGALDVDAGGGADVEGVGVVAALGVAEGVVNVHVDNIELGGLVDAKGLDGRVLDREALDVGVGHLVGAEELGLGLAAVAALGVPPALALAVDGVARGAVDGEAVAADGDEGTLPLLVAKGSLALEGDL